MNKIILGVIGLLVVGGAAYYVFAGSRVDSEVVMTESHPVTKEFTLRIANKSIIEGPHTLEATEGDTVVMHITADEAEEVHVHGYDKSVEFEANEEATLSFVADTSGNFPFELERSGTDLGAVQVLPR